MYTFPETGFSKPGQARHLFFLSAGKEFLLETAPILPAAGT